MLQKDISFIVLLDTFKIEVLEILLKSVRDQELSAYEILLLTDDAKKIPDTVTDKDSNIKIFVNNNKFDRKINSIKMVLQHASGKYITILSGRYIFQKKQLNEVLHIMDTEHLDFGILNIKNYDFSHIQQTSTARLPIDMDFVYQRSLAVSGALDTMVFRRQVIENFENFYLNKISLNFLLDIPLCKNLIPSGAKYKFLQNTYMSKNLFVTSGSAQSHFLKQEVSLLENLLNVQEMEPNRAQNIERLYAYNTIFPYVTQDINTDYADLLVDEVRQVNQAERLVLFFNVANRESISGGMLSIDRLTKLSKQFEQKFNFKVFQSAVPLGQRTVQYDFFDSTPVIPLEYFVQFTKPQFLLLNIPECFTLNFLVGLDKSCIDWLSQIPYIQVNIMNQNNLLMPSVEVMDVVKASFRNVTITTAHKSYTTQDLANTYSCPVYRLTPYGYEYSFKPFEEKENIIMLSPDLFARDEALTLKIHAHLRENLPDYQLLIIRKMKFEDYRELVSRVKFSITLGEGLDGYFAEPIHSGSVAFAIYNTTFFPSSFPQLDNVYQNLDSFMSNIVSDIRVLETNKDKYQTIQSESKLLLDELYNHDMTISDLLDFYQGVPTFLPG